MFVAGCLLARGTLNVALAAYGAHCCCLLVCAFCSIVLAGSTYCRVFAPFQLFLEFSWNCFLNFFLEFLGMFPDVFSGIFLECPVRSARGIGRRIGQVTGPLLSAVCQYARPAVCQYSRTVCVRLSGGVEQTVASIRSLRVVVRLLEEQNSRFHPVAGCGGVATGGPEQNSRFHPVAACCGGATGRVEQ